MGDDALDGQEEVIFIYEGLISMFRSVVLQKDKFVGFKPSVVSKCSS